MKDEVTFVNKYLEGLNLIVLISEKHIVLRRIVEEKWLSNEKEAISHTEALLLAKLSMGKISLAEVARCANVSRQAMFKCAKKLEEKGYLTFISQEGHHKYTQLTSKGVAYCERSRQLKMEIEQEISQKIGEESVELLKQLLMIDWI